MQQLLRVNMPHGFRILVLSAALFIPISEIIADEPSDLASAYELFTSKKDAEAKAAYEIILARNSKSDQAVYYLARLAKRQRDWVTVSARMEDAVKIAPDNATYWADLAEAYGAQARKAGPLTQLGLAKKTLAALKKAAALDPSDMEVRNGLIEFYREAPWIAGGGIDKAYDEAKSVEKIDPYRSAILLGGLHQRERQYADAEKDFLEAIRLQPGNPDARFALAQLYSLSGRVDESFDMFEDILKGNPENYAALYQIGRVAAASGKRLDRGEAALRQYLESPDQTEGLPSHAHAWHRLGNVLERKGDVPGARDAYKKALELDPRLKEADVSLKQLS